MATIATILKTAMKQIKNSPGKSLNANIEDIGNSDSECEIYHIPGIFSLPVKNTIGVCFDVGGLKIIIGTHNYTIDESIDEGETLIYSMLEDGTIKSKIYLNKSGEIVANDGTDYAVKYNELKTAFDKLKSDFNSLVSLYNAHIHAIPGVMLGGPGTASSPTVSTGSPSTADMSNSKVEKVRL